ncbi:protein YIPF2 [Microcaecilia unicolor]|uniref:Protein YIPF n=1 Tax=Microcaecilia unicolor TaxID=1415580 RepID=A0A6P7XI49_9AMPH|nr:protein YIPF2 [Microcaecilia unicolor]XP_030052882.1 protein YIPF2 [Microcaecilia unicolor]XP_030052884.1 protein YIPF2 [Microcaecilia unicolor]
MASAEDLKFQEFEEASELLASNPEATTRSISDGQSHVHVNMSFNREEEEGSGEETDQTELLGKKQQQPGFWTFEYYQTLFDIDTKQVLNRIMGSLLPLPGKNFVRHHLRNTPDLYGPFWICATLVFTVAFSSNLHRLFQRSNSTFHYHPEFNKVTIAAIAIFGYAWLVPLGLWGFLQWRKGSSMAVSSYTLLETICVYGYSLFVYIPTAFLAVAPYEWLGWILLSFAMIVSGSVLLLTFWPSVRGDTRLAALLTVTCIITLHALLTLGCKLYFFSSWRSTASDVHHTTAAVPQTVMMAHTTLVTHAVMTKHT